ncbi:hypothetical protein [Microbacterium pumilum]|uniref:Uncharacterized protein n=1 Tax=Microbacterium pumilum TaxID=344165 RepID=A0ABN2S2Z9_9MICO
MTDDVESETQWTTAAREAYSARGEELLNALREHIALTLTRTGRQAEHAQYVPSAAQLHAAAVAFDDAEFDWCGSFPLGLDADRWDDDEEDEDEEEDDSDILTVVGRWDYRVVDETALISAGRAAYARAWVDDTDEDASIAVPDAASAARELAHLDGWGVLEHAEGLESLASTQTVILHEDDGASWFDNDGDPYAILRDD